MTDDYRVYGNWGLLLGVYSYLQSAKTIEIQKNQNSNALSDAETLAGLEKKLTVEEKANVKAVLGYADYAEYYNDSLLMQIDANNTPTTELVFSVQADDEKNEASITKAYENILKTGITEWLIKGGMDSTEASKVNELIITDDEWIFMENDELAQFEMSFVDKSDSLNVTIVHLNEDNCKELANQVSKYVFENKNALEKVYGAHKIELVRRSYATVVQEQLLSEQRKVLVNISNGITYIDKLKPTFTAEQNQYYDLLKKGVRVDIAENATDGSVMGSEPVVATQSPSVSIKYVVLGMVLFVFIYVFYVFVAFITNNKLRTDDNLTDLFGMVQLGIVPTKENKKRFLGFVDGWILAIRNRNKRKFTVEEAEEIVAVAIKIAVKKSEGKEVCLVGCDVKKQTNDTCKKIQSILEKEDIKVNILDNVLYNAEEMEKLENVRYAVLVEKAGSTMYDEVAKELELMERYNINVLGGILAE